MIKQKWYKDTNDLQSNTHQYNLANPTRSTKPNCKRKRRVKDDKHNHETKPETNLNKTQIHPLFCGV